MQKLSGSGLLVILLNLWVSQAFALEIQGEWRQGELLIGQVVPGSEVRFLDKSVRLTEQGQFVIGLDRDAPSQVSLHVMSPEGETQIYDYSVAKREYNIQRIEGVPPQTVNPPAEALPRIRRESALTRKAREQDLPRTDFLSEFQWPLTGPITGVYGSQRYYNGEPRRPHYGVDIARPTGTPVQAPAPGVVTLAYDDMFFSGGTLIIDHGHGLSSTFIHLSEIMVAEGDPVTQGQAVAKVGATGRVTGPHLDWRMNWFDQRLDPQQVVPSMPETE